MKSATRVKRLKSDLFHPELTAKDFIRGTTDFIASAANDFIKLVLINLNYFLIFY